MTLSHRGRVIRNSALAAAAVAVVAVVVLVVLQLKDAATPFGSPSCQASADGATFEVSPEQMANVATITGISVKRGLPARAATIALATARQESKFVNVGYGDRDSLGLFQQRPSQGWGTAAQVQDPVYATNAFYDRLIKVKGYRSMAITEVAQQVQRSAYPQAYADHEPEGRVYASALTGNSVAALTCRLKPGAAPGGAGAVTPFLAALAREQAAVRSTRLSSSGAAGVRLASADRRTAWSLAHYAVASAQRFGIARVYVDGRLWDRAKPDRGWSPSSEGGSGVVVMFSASPPPPP